MYTQLSARRLVVMVLLISTVSLLSMLPALIFFIRGLQNEPSLSDHAIWPSNLPLFGETVAYWADSPLSGSFEIQSMKLGQRASILREWVRSHSSYPNIFDPKLSTEAVENAAITLFPFLAHMVRNSKGKTLVEKLQPFFNKSSRGIVIPTAVDTLRHTFHLLGALTEVLLTDLPIQIVYGGNDGLRSFQREMLAYRFPNISFLDINTIIAENSLRLDTSDRALKIFSALATTFEQFILLDENKIFLQKPDVLFENRAYHRTGALLFEPRLLSSTRYQEFDNPRVIKSHPSNDWVRDSLAREAQYSQEKDTDVVVVDKSRLDVLIGLLHASWQTVMKEGLQINSTTPYGESTVWRLAFELTNAPHQLQNITDIVIGWPRQKAGVDICSFADGYTNADGGLLWYSSPLLREDVSDSRYQNVPTHRMAVSPRQGALNNRDVLCTVRQRAEALTSAQQQVDEEILLKAQQLDLEFGLVKMHNSLTSSDM